MNLSGSKSLTSAANLTENFSVSNLVIGPTPLRPLMSAAHVVSTVLPIGVIRPNPVTTTRRAKLNSLESNDRRPVTEDRLKTPHRLPLSHSGSVGPGGRRSSVFGRRLLFL